MATFTIVCPNCGMTGDVDASYANRRVKCTCGQSFIAAPPAPVNILEAPAHAPAPSAPPPASAVEAGAAGPLLIDATNADAIDRLILQLSTAKSDVALEALADSGTEALERLFEYSDGVRKYQWSDELDAQACADNVTRAYGQIGQMCLGELLAALPVAQPHEYRHLIYTLGRVDNPRVVEPLMAALNSADAKVRLYAISGLQDRHAKKALGAIMDCLADEDEKVQFMAVGAVSELGDKETLTHLHQRFEETTDPREQRSIREAIEWLSMQYA